MKRVHKIIRSVEYSLKGLRHAYRVDESFRMEVVWGLPAYAFVAFLLLPMQIWEILLLTFSYLLILLVELINNAFETMLNKVHPERHEEIGRSKDIASAAVLLAFLFAALTVALLFIARISHDVPLQVEQFFV